MSGMLEVTLAGRSGEDVASSSPGRPGRSRGRADRGDRRQGRKGLWFVAPWLIGLAAFYLIPIIASLAMSFTDYQLVDQDNDGTAFVGLDNWAQLFDDPEVGHSAWVTLKFAVIFLPTVLLVPLGAAYLLTAKHLWGKPIFRLLFYLPAIVPFVAATAVWRGYLNDTTGWLNRLLGTVGIDAPDWLSDETWVLPALVMISLWGIGNAIIIYMAALRSVPSDLYEAATIDGAGPWRLFRDVTWPLISPVTFYNLVIALVALGQYFLVPFVLTNGNGDPNNATLFYTMYFYRQTFVFHNGGYGSALAWAMLLVVLGATALLFWSARYWVHYEYEAKS
jgi:multiple sugar transport system permease protein